MCLLIYQNFNVLSKSGQVESTTEFSEKNQSGHDLFNFGITFLLHPRAL